jgi:hypothetical protein
MRKTTERVFVLEGVILLYVFGSVPFERMTTLDHVGAICGAVLLLAAVFL